LAVKKRVFQVAREFSISNEALIDFLKGHGYDIRNHMSPVVEDAFTVVSDNFGAKQQPVVVDTEGDFRKKLKDLQAKEKEDVEKTRHDLEEKLRVASEWAEEKPKIVKERQDRIAAKPVAPPPVFEEKPAEVKAKVDEPVVADKKPKSKPKRKLKIVEIPREGIDRSKRDRPQPERQDRDKAIAAKDKASGGSGADGKKPEEKNDQDQASKRKRRRGGQKKAEGAATPSTPTSPSSKNKNNKKKKKRRPQFNEAEIQESIRQTMASMSDSTRGKKKKYRNEVGEIEEVEEIKSIKVSEFMSLSELAKLMQTEATEIIRKCMELGMMVTINQRLDMETIALLATEFGYEVEALSEFGEDILEDLQDEDDESTLESRPPVVTIMGHVDHGKTSLLDHIRESNIIAGESGGITQHIGAYEVTVKDKEITFLDTPGHEAFSAMRARGAQITDIVILVVAADDSVMPQTIEAISHAKAAGVPIVVAINKVDKPSANPDMIRQQLADHGVLVEQWGGKNQAIEISAKTGQNIDSLLESIILEAELLDLKANPNRKAQGVVIEAKLDKGKGVVSTVLVQNGTLRVGDPFIAGTYSGKVRSTLDERGRRKKEAGPSVPVQVLGFNGVPQAGDSLVVLNSERDTREISQKRQQLQREHEHWRSRPRTLDEISKQIKQGQVKQLSVVLKTDVDGSLEAITDSLQKLATDEVAVDVIHRGVGAVTESDVLLASASGAIIVGFHVRPVVKARQLAEREAVDIRSYNVIYDIVNDVKAALEGFLEPTLHEKNVGTIEIRQVFKVPKIGVIAGSYVVSGKVTRKDLIKIYREDRLVHEGKIGSLRRFKDDAKEVAAGFECGVSIDKYNDLKVNDIIEVYEIIEEKRTL
jgi:translation initiation factor IF-2